VVVFGSSVVQTDLVGREHREEEHYYEQLDIDAAVSRLCGSLSRGEPASIEEALAFLEADPYFFRSGYARERVARRLARADLTLQQRARARMVLLSTVDGRRHCPHPGAGRLARTVADNTLRRELRSRLHHPDGATARRALQMVVNVRRPGFAPEDIAAAQALVLADAARGTWLSPTVARLARYLWSSEWEEELRRLLPHHGPDRAAAKRLIHFADQRRQRRSGP
jgi:hypothetical protein